MPATFRYIAFAAAATISVIGCRDQKDPLAPQAPSKMIIVQQPPIIQLPRPSDLMEIVAGDLHTCIRKRSGAVACWGWNEYGQIGVSTTTQCGTFSSDGPCWKQPVQVTAPTNANFTSATRITAGSFHTCALEPS